MMISIPSLAQALPNAVSATSPATCSSTVGSRPVDVDRSSRRCTAPPESHTAQSTPTATRIAASLVSSANNRPNVLAVASSTMSIKQGRCPVPNQS